MITWNNLICRSGNETDKNDYYNCDYTCPKQKEKLIETLKNQGVMEYIDVDELDTCLVAFSRDVLEKTSLKKARYTHCELHASMILGPLGFICPFSNHSQSARNVFGAGQGKQAV